MCLSGKYTKLFLTRSKKPPLKRRITVSKRKATPSRLLWCYKTLRKSKVIKSAKNYFNQFKSNKNITDVKICEYRDFVRLHVDHGYLIKRLNTLDKFKVFDHSESVLNFLKLNNSKVNYTKSNFLHQFNNTTIITILSLLISGTFSLGYLIGALNSSKIDDLNKKIDSLIIKSSTNIPNNKTNSKTKIDNQNQQNNKLNNSNLNHNSKN